MICINKDNTLCVHFVSASVNGYQIIAMREDYCYTVQVVLTCICSTDNGHCYKILNGLLNPKTAKTNIVLITNQIKNNFMFIS